MTTVTSMSTRISTAMRTRGTAVPSLPSRRPTRPLTIMTDADGHVHASCPTALGSLAAPAAVAGGVQTAIRLMQMDCPTEETLSATSSAAWRRSRAEVQPVENLNNAWRASENYEFLSDDEFVETFELAPPSQP